MSRAKSRARAGRRRRTVRIVRPRLPRTAALSLLVAVVTAGVLFGVWRFFRQDEHPVINPRGLSDVYLNWRCTVGHSFRALGQVQPRACPTCGRLSYPVAVFLCPEHGEHEVAIRYALDADGEPQPTEFRVGRGKWVSLEDLRCPRCAHRLIRKPRDPFEDRERGPRSGGG